MKMKMRRISALVVILLFVFEGLVLAGAKLSSVRFHSGREHDRVVFELNQMPKYKVRLNTEGDALIVDLADVSASGLKRASFHGKRIESVKYSLKQDHVVVTLKLMPDMGYKVQELKNPDRVFVDVLPKSQLDGKKEKQGKDEEKPRELKTGIPGMYAEEIAPGLIKKAYTYWDADGQVTAYFLEADKDKYTVKPALARGQVPGRETVLGIAKRYGAEAAVNASYFAASGDILGITRIDNMVAGTTYFKRSAFGLHSDGKPEFGKIEYDGHVKLGDVTMPVWGVDCERGENSLIIYNSAYGKSTRTNEFGEEYIIRNGKVAAIDTDGNAGIPSDGYVVSVHGSSQEAFKGLRVGDPASLSEDMGARWADCPQILGVGPRLLTGGRVNVTASEEEFPSDIRVGRAPRSAIGVTKTGNFLLGVVDGRQAESHGLTLTEWAGLMKKMGAVDAINFDGGGSSELVIKGEIQNSPSDGKERPVGTALIVVKK